MVSKGILLGGAMVHCQCSIGAYEELQWLDFTCSGVELEPGGADRNVNRDITSTCQSRGAQPTQSATSRVQSRHK
eukprot:6456596-Amphidinium_carterae.1